MYWWKGALKCKPLQPRRGRSPAWTHAAPGLLSNPPERLRRILRDYIGAVRSAKPELVGMSEQSLSKAQLPDLVTEMQAIDVRHRSRSMGARLGGWTAKRLGSPEES